MQNSALRTSIACTFLGFVVSATPTFRGAPNSAPTKPRLIPANCSSIPLKEMREDDPRLESCMRAHAWDLFSKLVDPHGEPTWGEWCFVLDHTPRRLLCSDKAKNDFQILSNAARINTARLKMHFGLLLSEGEPRQSIGTALSSSTTPNSAKQLRHALGAGNPSGLPPSAQIFTSAMVVFSPDTVTKMTDCFNSATDDGLAGFNRITLDLLHPKCTEKSFSDSLTGVQSIALKTVWAVVTDSGQNGPPVSTTVPVWVDPNPDDPSTTHLQSGASRLDPTGANKAAPDLGSWNTWVKLALDDSPCSANTSFRPSRTGKPIVPLNCFYHFPVTLEEYNLFLQWAHVRSQIAAPHTAENMYFVLLGIHVAKKEIDNWTWQTFWWNWKAKSDDQSPYQMDQYSQGAINDGRWSHYAASVTYGPPVSKPADYSPRPAFNPYLEAPLPNGTRSNCFTCHQFAVLRKRTAPDSFYRSQRIALGTCDPSAGIKPNGCTVEPAQPRDFHTDFLYSLADVNVFPNQENLLSFGEPRNAKIDELTQLFAAQVKGKVIEQK